MTTEPGSILHDVRGGVAWLEISNPARRNALSERMMSDLAALVRALDADPAVHVLVLRGAGDAFSAGADISEFAAHHDSDEARDAHTGTLSGLFETLSELSTPLIAMIRGYCLGAGMALAISADLRIAAEGSRFGIPAARLGVGYPVALGEVLVHVVGPAHAGDILFTGRTLGDAEALAAGLLTRLVPADRLEDEVAQLAATIAANAPLSVRAAKATIKAAIHPRLLPQAHAAVAACAGSADEREGQRAFTERRAPVFRGA